MSIQSTDDMGSFIDTCVAILPAARPNTTTDIHSLINLPEHDTGVSAAHPPVLAQPARSPGQRR
jgi:hypothetical protein